MIYSLNISLVYIKFLKIIVHFSFSENFYKANIHIIKANIYKISLSYTNLLIKLNNLRGRETNCLITEEGKQEKRKIHVNLQWKVDL